MRYTLDFILEKGLMKEVKEEGVRVLNSDFVAW